jgi:hypothetical protein
MLPEVAIVLSCLVIGERDGEDLVAPSPSETSRWWLGWRGGINLSAHDICGCLPVFLVKWVERHRKGLSWLQGYVNGSLLSV